VRFIFGIDAMPKPVAHPVAGHDSVRVWVVSPAGVGGELDAAADEGEDPAGGPREPPKGVVDHLVGPDQNPDGALPMHPNAPRHVPAVLDVIPFSAPSGELAWVHCIKCNTSLDLLQPATDFPDRLLGVCKSCGRWALIELVPDEPEAVMILLPEGGWALNALRAREPTQPPGRESLD
jgi:hypothetical protein